MSALPHKLCPECGFSEEAAWEAGYEAGKRDALEEMRAEYMATTSQSGATTQIFPASASVSFTGAPSFMDKNYRV